MTRPSQDFVPSCTPATADRRENRERACDEALRRYLEAQLEKAGLAAVVLTDDEGLLAGKSRNGDNLHRLAAIGTACAGSRDVSDQDYGTVTRGQDLFAHQFRSHGRTYCLTTLSGRVSSVREVARAVDRILGISEPQQR